MPGEGGQPGIKIAEMTRTFGESDSCFIKPGGRT